MKKIIGYSLLFVSFFIASVIATLPVNVVLEWVSLPRALQIQGASGTVWQGQATSVRWQRYQLGALQWQFRPSELFSGAAVVQVRFGRGNQWQLSGKGLVGYSLSDGAFAQNVVASLPAAQVLDQLKLPIPVPLSVTGNVDINIKQAIYGAPWCASGEGSLAWTGSAVNSQIGTVALDLNLDQVIADVQCQNSQLTLEGRQSSNHVIAEFDAELTPQRQYSASAWFKPEAQFPAELANYLKFIGSPDGQGRYRFTQAGRI
ncbi:type II secretion system protein N [Vibrio sp. SM6]|uniref:Type II secretion system protein N n=1 Tax=Vibrio agarilyticus TaxID=2726741 RepID=A0A7X8TTF8_9VIBR|nr:type II secretion system protein N [Vibrio agarilyticus]NLS14478.1 type II secretion system protein N [Vibrio agarilyticus]